MRYLKQFIERNDIALETKDTRQTKRQFLACTSVSKGTQI